ncbi:helix-turn-helix domain-containing protein [Kiloniella laminariae]|uniref:helix-turn-helix domain-containing protein n=1 Tax=Kiloniella laminariae TaxID=454162 RepID=UPI0003A9C36B|nr:helix-turn-helix transcriptional regulator [Kiloniella laminariae]
MDLHENLKSNIERYLDSKGLGKKAFAREAGLKEQVVIRILNDVTANPRVDTAAALARCIGTSIDKLLGIDTIDQPADPILYIDMGAAFINTLKLENIDLHPKDQMKILLEIQKMCNEEKYRQQPELIVAETGGMIRMISNKDN